MSENPKIEPDINGGIDEKKKNILPSNESQPVEEITTEQKRQQSLVDKFLNSPYIEKNHDLDKIFNSAEDSKYQINNLLNYYKKAQIEFLYTLTAYFQSDNDNNIYMSYPFSTLEHQITLYRIQFSEIERSIYNILLRNIISKRYIKNILDGAKIESMSELDEKKIEDLIEGLQNIEMQSGGSGGSDENFNDFLKISKKNLSNKITTSIAEFINFKADVTINRFVKEEMIIKEFTKVAKEYVLKDNFSLANLIFSSEDGTVDGLVGGGGPYDLLTTTDTNPVESTSQLTTISPDEKSADIAVASMTSKKTTTQKTSMNELVTAIAKQYDFTPQTSQKIRQDYEDLSVAVKSMSNPKTTTFTINSEQINIMISDEMKQFIDNVSKSSTPGDKNIEGEVKLDSKKETIKRFSTKFRQNHKSFIYDEIVKGSPVEDINTNLYNKFGNDGKVKINSLDGTEYQMLSELGSTFETDIETNLMEIASDANTAFGSFIKTIRDQRNGWEAVYMTNIENMISGKITEEQSNKLQTAFNKLTEQSLTVINTNNVEAKQKYETLMTEFLSNMIDNANKLYNLNSEELQEIDPDYLSGKEVTVESDKSTALVKSSQPSPSVKITAPTMLIQDDPDSETGKMVTTIAQRPALQSEKTQLAIQKIPKIDNQINEIQVQINEKQTSLEETESQLFTTQDWLTKEEIKNSRKQIISDNTDTSLINKVKNQLGKQLEIKPEVSADWLSWNMEQKEDSITWSIPKNASQNLKELVGKLTIITGGDEPTKYDIIIQTLTSDGTLLARSNFYGSWTPETIDTAVKEKSLPSSWFSTQEDTTQETKNGLLNEMSIDDFDVTTYTEASLETQKNWIYKNWQEIRAKNANAKAQVTTPEYQNQLETVIEQTGLIIIDENKINNLLGQKVEIQKETLPALLKSDLKNLQDKTLKAKEIVTNELAKDIMSRYKTMREALDTTDNGINIKVEFKDEGNKRAYQFTINVFESDILSTLNSLKVTDSLLDIEFSLLTDIKEKKDQSQGYFDSLKNINIFSSKSNEEILEDIDFRIQEIKKKEKGIGVSIDALFGIYKNLDEFTRIDGGDIPKHLAQIVNLNGTIPQLQEAVMTGYKEGLSLGEQQIIKDHKLIKPDFDILKSFPDFKVDQFYEMYIVMNRLYTEYKLPLKIAGGTVAATGGALIYRSFDPAGALSQTVGAFIMPIPGIMYAVGSGVVNYYPIAGISYLGLESLNLVPTPYSGLGRYALNRAGLEQVYNQILYKEAGLISYFGVLPSRYSSDIDAGIYMNTMNTYRLTDYEAYQFWNRIPNPTTNGSTYIYQAIPPTQKDLIIYHKYGGYNTSYGFIGNPNPGNLIKFPPYPQLDSTDTDAQQPGTISFAEKQNFALMENMNVGALAIGMALFLWGQKKMMKTLKENKGEKKNSFSFWTTISSIFSWKSSITIQHVQKQLNYSKSQNNNYINAFNNKRSITEDGEVVDIQILKQNLYLTTLNLIQLAIFKEIGKSSDPAKITELTNILNNSNKTFEEETNRYNKDYFLEELITKIPDSEGNVSLNIVNERLIDLLRSTEFQSRGKFKEIYGISVDNLREVTTDLINSERPTIEGSVGPLGFTDEQLIGEGTELPEPDQTKIEAEENRQEEAAAAAAAATINPVQGATSTTTTTATATIPEQAATQGCPATLQIRRLLNKNKQIRGEEKQATYNEILNAALGEARPDQGCTYPDIKDDYIALKTKLSQVIDNDINVTGETIENVAEEIDNMLVQLYQGEDTNGPLHQLGAREDFKGGKKKKGSKKNKVEKKKGRKTKRKMYTKKKKGNSKKHKKKSKVKRNTRRK
jgi:hypothetical protein